MTSIEQIASHPALAEAEILKLRAQLQQRWKPIETAPRDEQVLVYMQVIDAIDIAHKPEGLSSWISGGGTKWPAAAVSHWMPLPPPPTNTETPAAN